MTTGGNGETFSAGRALLGCGRRVFADLPPESAKCSDADHKRLERIVAGFKRIRAGALRGCHREGGREAFADAARRRRICDCLVHALGGAFAAYHAGGAKQLSSQITGLSFKINRDDEGTRSVTVSFWIRRSGRRRCRFYVRGGLSRLRVRQPRVRRRGVDDGRALRCSHRTRTTIPSRDTPVFSELLTAGL